MTDAQSRVDQITWYHEFDFGNGVRTRSSHENIAGVRDVWRFIEDQLERVPFGGADVLDVGAWDGYWSFLAERRGAATVLATDDASQRWPTASPSGILLARELLGSRIAVREDLPVYNLAALGLTFDVILVLGVFYHLWDPLHALVQVRHCCHRDTIVIIEGELAYAGTTPYEARYFQSDWQECILAAPLLERLLQLAYFRVDEQVWMHPLSPDGTHQGELKTDRSMLVCRPFEGTNGAYTYAPHFGLHRFDDRFRATGGPAAPRGAELRLVDISSTPQAGTEFQAAIEVVNTGAAAWRALTPRAPGEPILSGHSIHYRSVWLDLDETFLRKQIVPGEYVNRDPVGHYRRYIEENWLQGGVTLGVQLWDGASGALVDQDYSRGFLGHDVLPGGSHVVTVRMRAPLAPGHYQLRFDMVCEYVCWFSSEGSSPLILDVTIA